MTGYRACKHEREMSNVGTFQISECCDCGEEFRKDASTLDEGEIFAQMHQLAEAWQELTGGGAFFELVTKDGAKVQCATKNSKRKV